MAFFKVTYNQKYRFATLHNFGCTFRCPVCSYKLRSGANGTPGRAFPRPDKFLGVDQMKTSLRSLAVDKVFFMGGEPTVAVELPEMLDFAKNTLGAKTYLGHTNGSRLPLDNLDGANVGLKAWDERAHLGYTGQPKQRIFDNFAAGFRAGLEMKANVVFVPGLVDLDQIEAIAAWLASLSRDIPFHIMGYIPVPGMSWFRPTEEQMVAAVTVAKQHLGAVKYSHLTVEQAVSLEQRDDRFAVQQVL
jgi:pyruvate formate lyase activating enzyme